jgi:hypothetical protein
MNVLLALVLAAVLCGLLVAGLASVLRDLLRRDVRFSETPPAHLARKDNRYGIAAAAPARNAASGTGSHAKVQSSSVT